MVVFNLLKAHKVDKFPRIEGTTITYTMHHMPTKKRSIKVCEAARIFDDLYGEAS